MSDAKLVYPGEELGTAEEFIAGPGTYVQDHLILAAQIGHAVYDTSEMLVRVRPLRQANSVRVGDVVVCMVDDLKSSMVTLDVLRIEGADRHVAGETHAAIHVAKISPDYVRELSDVYRITDIVRAKVFQAEPSIQLETVAPDLGVIKALCGVCRGTLEPKGRDLWCPECERTETRKVSTRYGMENPTGTEHAALARTEPGRASP
jgi:exosome complex component CSL4